MKPVRIALLASAALCSTLAGAQSTAKLKVGLMLPATFTLSSLGTAIENGFKLYVTEQGG
jgi:branched-chain amino acid transport system substrate-binding protein